MAGFGGGGSDDDCGLALLLPPGGGESGMVLPDSISFIIISRSKSPRRAESYEGVVMMALA